MNTGKQKPGKRYPLVNWADGMPVNKKHFIQLEDHFTDRLCEYQSFQLNRANYGLLPSGKEKPFPVISASRNLSRALWKSV